MGWNGNGAPVVFGPGGAGPVAGDGAVSELGPDELGHAQVAAGGESSELVQFLGTEADLDLGVHRATQRSQRSPAWMIPRTRSQVPAPRGTPLSRGWNMAQLPQLCLPVASR